MDVYSRYIQLYLNSSQGCDWQLEKKENVINSNDLDNHAITHICTITQFHKRLVEAGRHLRIFKIHLILLVHGSVHSRPFQHGTLLCCPSTREMLIIILYAALRHQYHIVFCTGVSPNLIEIITGALCVFICIYVYVYHIHMVCVYDKSDALISCSKQQRCDVCYS